MGQQDDYDVVIVGYGPCGQALAAMLGKYGHRVAAFERHESLYNLPRAGHVDHEIMRILQALGVAQALVDADAVPIRKYYWFNGAGRDLMTMHWDKKEVSGWESDYMMWQPELERLLDGAVREQPTAEVHQGWEAIEIAQQDDHVELTLERTRRGEDGRRARTGETRVVRARYVVGADGSNGFVRDAVGIEREDHGFDERWLDVDTRPKRNLAEGAGRVGEKDITFGMDVFQICDPARPRYLAPLGRNHRRFEWSLLPGESTDEFERPEKAYELLFEWGVTPDDLEIARQAVYTFEAKVAAQFRKANVFLVGDAAHSMPPHMGQGMCTGIRDAKTLAWKLDLVLRGVAPEQLLDTYEAERKPNAQGWVDVSVAVGRISATLDSTAAAERDAAFERGDAPPIPPLPTLTAGVLSQAADNPVVGSLAPQGLVNIRGREGLFDDLVGHDAFSVLSVVGDPRLVLAPELIDTLERLPTTFAHISSEDDLEGVYGNWFAEHGIEAVIVRPDFYVFATVPTLAELPTAVTELIGLLQMSACAAVG